MSSSVYIAAPFTHWKTAYALRAAINNAPRGELESTSSWINVAMADNGRERNDRELARRAIEENDRELHAAHVVLAIVVGGAGRAMFGEIRYAQALGVPVLWSPVDCAPWLDAYRPRTFRAPTAIEAAAWLLELAPALARHECAEEIAVSAPGLLRELWTQALRVREALQ